MRNYLLIEILLSIIALFLFIITLIIAPEWLRETIYYVLLFIFLILIFGLYCWAIFRFVSNSESSRNDGLVMRIFTTIGLVILSIVMFLVIGTAANS
jgi:hypothetical protein